MAEISRLVKELPSSGGLRLVGHCIMERRRLKRTRFTMFVRGICLVEKAWRVSFKRHKRHGRFGKTKKAHLFLCSLLAEYPYPQPFI